MIKLFESILKLITVVCILSLFALPFLVYLSVVSMSLSLFCFTLLLVIFNIIYLSRVKEISFENN